jgi:hypothetical protein
MVRYAVACMLTLASGMALAAPPEIEGYTLTYADDFENDSGKWEFTDANAWKITGEAGAKALSLCGESAYTPQVRSPRSIARMKDLTAGDFILDVKVQQTGREYGHRDACVFFGHTSPTEFYYVHLATVADDHANSIFLVNNAPRVSIAKERTKGTDWAKGYQHVRIKREGDTIEVYFNDMEKPVMKAQDTTFASGGLGLGSFDDTADFDDLAIYVKKK